MAADRGLLALVLQAHLPWVRHPEYESFLEEDWLFEAITETYLPLLATFERLSADDVPYRVTISLSPPLLNMLGDPLLRARYERYLESRIALAEREVDRTRHDPSFAPLAQHYLDAFTRARTTYTERYRGNLIAAFAALADTGSVRLMTSAATHGCLPLLAVNEQAVRMQVGLGMSEFRRLFGRPTSGFWLPECAYYSGLDRILAEAGIRYFCVDTHAIELASSPPVHGVYAPIFCPAGVAAFGRDAECARQVWSSVEGYPGDFDYREFYRDIGFDLPMEDVRPFLPASGERVYTGIKYYRVTGTSDHKEAYNPEWARAKAELHAQHFVESRARQLSRMRDGSGRPPLLTVPFDAELFGHWWYEGPIWLDYLCRHVAAQDAFRLTTLDEYLDAYPTHQVAEPNTSSWGFKGYHEVWLSSANDWIYAHLHHAADRMVSLARRYPEARGVQKRALDQAARELLLAQASDWAFIIARGTVVDYAVRRTTEHLARFRRLADGIEQGGLDEQWLAAVESADNLFPAIDSKRYA
jgi:1,4-alpha-glucan branching enzyme